MRKVQWNVLMTLSLSILPSSTRKCDRQARFFLGVDGEVRGVELTGLRELPVKELQTADDDTLTKSRMWLDRL